MANIGIVGGGSWGTALALVLNTNNHQVDIWLRDNTQVEAILETRENKKYLPGVAIPEEIGVTSDIEKAIHKKDLIVLAVPSHAVRQTLNAYKHLIDKSQILLNVSKGIENDTLLRVSQIVKAILPDNPYAILSGPSHAEEVARNMPTTVVVASEDMEVAKYIQDVFMGPYFRVYTNPDVVGVELGGALKNVIALGAGISDGLGYGDNTKAALMTRGIIEIARLGEKMGADRSTFGGLAGIGDLIVTCTSMHSRNRRAGILIGKGKKLTEVIEEVGMVVEGIKTTKSAYHLSIKHGVNMPITKEIYGVLYEGKDVKASVFNLMLRDKKHELEDIIKSC